MTLKNFSFPVFNHRYFARTLYPQATYFVGIAQTLDTAHYMTFDPASGMLKDQTDLSGPNYGAPVHGFTGVEVPLAYFEHCFDLP